MAAEKRVWVVAKTVVVVAGTRWENILFTIRNIFFIGFYLMIVQINGDKSLGMNIFHTILFNSCIDKRG